MHATRTHPDLAAADRGHLHARRMVHGVAERGFWVALAATTIVALTQVGSVVLGVAGPFAGLGLLPLAGWAAAVAAAGVAAVTHGTDSTRPGWLVPVVLSAAVYPVAVAALLHVLGAGAA